MLAKQIAQLLGHQDDADTILAIDKLITKSFAEDHFRKEMVYKVAFNRTPPHSEEAEDAFLGACLLNPSKAVAVNADFREDYFFQDRTRLVWRAMLALYRKGALISPEAIADWLSTVSVGSVPANDITGGVYGIQDLMFGRTSWEEAPGFARVVIKNYIKREFIDKSIENISKMYLAEDPETIRGSFVDVLSKLGAEFNAGSVVDSSRLAAMVQDHTQKLYDFKQKGIQPDWAMSPLTELNEMVGGWKPSDLVIIAGRPGMGKTAYMMSEIDYAIQCGEPIAVFSLEMSTLQLGLRHLVMNTMVRNQALRVGDLGGTDMIEIANYARYLSGLGLFIDDTPGIRIDKLESVATSLKENHGITRIYVDYLQLVTIDSRGSRELEVAEITRRLKGLAKKLGIPVIALAQLSRAVEARGGSKRPQLSDLRETGEIEQAADVVGFVYRPEYYDIMEDEEGNDLRGVAEIIIAKHRNGPVGTVRARFLPESMKWTNFEREYSRQTHAEDDINDLF